MTDLGDEDGIYGPAASRSTIAAPIGGMRGLLSIASSIRAITAAQPRARVQVASEAGYVAIASARAAASGSSIQTAARSQAGSPPPRSPQSITAESRPSLV